jgi:hypothetical protein
MTSMNSDYSYLLTLHNLRTEESATDRARIVEEWRATNRRGSGLVRRALTALGQLGRSRPETDEMERPGEAPERRAPAPRRLPGYET